MLDTLLIIGMMNVTPSTTTNDSTYAAMMERTSNVKMIVYNNDAVATREEVQANVPEGTGAIVSYIDHQ